MSLSEPVGAILWNSNSGCGDADRSKFVCCVDGRDPEVHEVLIWGDDKITPKVHPTARVDVNPWISRVFATNYFTETGFRTSIFCKKIINGSFEFLGLADPLRTRGPYWIDNLLCPSPRWEVGGTVENLNWGSQPGGRYGGVDVPWCGAVPACPAYIPRSPENVCATARGVCDNLLREHRLERAQILSNSCDINRDHLFDRTDCAWDNLWDELIDD